MIPHQLITIDEDLAEHYLSGDSLVAAKAAARHQLAEMVSLAHAHLDVRKQALSTYRKQLISTLPETSRRWIDHLGEKRAAEVRSGEVRLCQLEVELREAQGDFRRAEAAANQARRAKVDAAVMAHVVNARETSGRWHSIHFVTVTDDGKVHLFQGGTDLERWKRKARAAGLSGAVFRIRPMGEFAAEAPSDQVEDPGRESERPEPVRDSRKAAASKPAAKS